ncbi:anthranilate synthase component I family protein [Candidatus Kaiserbacteria bacterium]|nr:anthranilate synthase component I family protein [Candidatus Kaiserbacteria bacterium]
MKRPPKIKLENKPTYVKFAEDIDFFSLFKKIEREFDSCFFFESLGEQAKFARYSIIGFGAEHIVSADAANFILDGEMYPTDNPYEMLRDIMPEHVASKIFAGGLVGYVGYDSVNFFEPGVHLKAHPVFPPFMFGVYTDGLILDRLTNEVSYFFYEKSRLEDLQRIHKKKVPASKISIGFVKDALSKDEHREIVARVKEHIRAGDIFQCQVGFQSEFELKGDTIKLYERLRGINPSPFMYYLKFGSKKIIGASPELHFSLRSGEMETHPTAGTIRRGTTEKEDALLARALLNDEKERAEHNMLVDLHRNDLGRVSRFGTVRVKELMTVRRFSHVQHLVSEITGLVRPGVDMFAAFASSFPGGTVSGTPKVEAMKITDRNEKEGRGPYGGGVGHFGFDGNCTFALTIRSLYCDGSYAYTETSSGIVYDSVPEKEYEEIQNKFGALRKVLGIKNTL